MTAIPPITIFYSDFQSLSLDESGNKKVEPPRLEFCVASHLRDCPLKRDAFEQFQQEHQGAGQGASTRCSATSHQSGSNSAHLSNRTPTSSRKLEGRAS